MKNVAGVRQEILDQINKTSIAYQKIARSPVVSTQGSIKTSKPLINRERLGRGQLHRAPSIESSKGVPFNKLRNKTIAKVNIGGFIWFCQFCSFILSWFNCWRVGLVNIFTIKVDLIFIYFHMNSNTDDQCVEEYKQVKFHKKHRYVVYKVEN